MSQHETNSSNVRENRAEDRAEGERNVTSEQDKEKLHKESTFAQR